MSELQPGQANNTLDSSKMSSDRCNNLTSIHTSKHSQMHPDATNSSSSEKHGQWDYSVVRNPLYDIESRKPETNHQYQLTATNVGDSKRSVSRPLTSYMMNQLEETSQVPSSTIARYRSLLQQEEDDEGRHAFGELFKVAKSLCLTALAADTQSHYLAKQLNNLPSGIDHLISYTGSSVNTCDMGCEVCNAGEVCNVGGVCNVGKVRQSIQDSINEGSAIEKLCRTMANSIRKETGTFRNIKGHIQTEAESQVANQFWDYVESSQYYGDYCTGLAERTQVLTKEEEQTINNALQSVAMRKMVPQGATLQRLGKVRGQLALDAFATDYVCKTLVTSGYGRKSWDEEDIAVCTTLGSPSGFEAGGFESGTDRSETLLPLVSAMRDIGSLFTNQQFDEDTVKALASKAISSAFADVYGPTFRSFLEANNSANEKQERYSMYSNIILGMNEYKSEMVQAIAYHLTAATNEISGVLPKNFKDIHTQIQKVTSASFEDSGIWHDEKSITNLATRVLKEVHACITQSKTDHKSSIKGADTTNVGDEDMQGSVE